MPRSSSSQRNHKPTSQSKSLIQKPSSSIGHAIRLQQSLGQTIKEGLAFGTGSAIAHRIFNPFPTSTTVQSDKKVEGPCEKERFAFETCMKTKSADDFCGNEQISYTQCIHLSR
jgi:hypothetical protein